MVIDIHVHTRTPIGARLDEEVAEMKHYAAHSGVDRVVHLFNVSETKNGPPGEAHVRANNDLAMKLVSLDPGFFTAFCYLNPANDPGFLVEEIDRTVAAGNLSGVKLWAWVNARDPRLDPIMERVVALGVPLLFHSFDNQLGPSYDESTPADVAWLARKHPQATIVAAHLGGGGFRGVAAVKATPNVLVDTAGSQPGTRLVEYAVQELGQERVVLGSDWPLRDMAVQKARVTGAKISPEAKALILGGNTARILNLDVAEGVASGA